MQNMGLRFSSVYPRRILSQRSPLRTFRRELFSTPPPGSFSGCRSVASQGTHRIVFTEASPAGGSVTASSIIEVDSGTPVVTRVVNAASRSEAAACSPGAIASLEGRWLVEGQAASDPTGHSTELSGTVVRVNGIEVPILSASISRVDFLCPAAAPGSTLQIALQTLTRVAQPIQTVSQETTPGIFSLDGSGAGQGMIMHSGTATMVMTPNYQYSSRAAAARRTCDNLRNGDCSSAGSVGGGGRMLKLALNRSLRCPASRECIGSLCVCRPVPRAETCLSPWKSKRSDGSIATSNEVRIATETIPN